MMNSFSFFFHLLSSLLLMLMILISVAFVTLMERKVLGYIQLRKGPNKVGLIGFVQPFNDAIKLFFKEIFILKKNNFYLYVMSPLLSMFLMLFLWILIPFNLMIFNDDLSGVYMFCVMSLMVFPISFSGWSSSSVYTLLGSLRTVAQTISYEVSMIMIMLSVMILMSSFNFSEYVNYQKYIWMGVFNFPLMLVFFISILAEINRTPFDFSEGESELISGFNTEYMSGLFAMIFIAEYGSIMFMMMLFYIFFLGSNFFSVGFYIIYSMILFLVFWIRGTFPRSRYDSLMYLCWLSFLPFSLSYLIFLIFMKIIQY